MNVPAPVFITPAWPAPDGVVAAATTRLRGVSDGPYRGFNLAAHVGDDGAAVSVNRRMLRQCLGLPSDPVWLDHCHGTNILDAAARVPSPAADGAVSATPGTVCAVLTADCLPVLLCDKRATCVAAVHAGWRGLLDDVLGAAIRRMTAGDPGDIMAWIGPAIGAGAYAVGADLRDRFVARSPETSAAFTRLGGQWHMDLAAVARQRLAHAGVVEVYAHGACTFAEPERFFSYRREHTTGRMASLVWLRPTPPAGHHG